MIKKEWAWMYLQEEIEDEIDKESDYVSRNFQYGKTNS